MVEYPKNLQISLTEIQGLWGLLERRIARSAALCLDLLSKQREQFLKQPIFKKQVRLLHATANIFFCILLDFFFPLFNNLHCYIITIINKHILE
jgi:hypothetical protein